MEGMEWKLGIPAHSWLYRNAVAWKKNMCRSRSAMSKDTFRSIRLSHKIGPLQIPCGLNQEISRAQELQQNNTTVIKWSSDFKLSCFCKRSYSEMWTKMQSLVSLAIIKPWPLLRQNSFTFPPYVAPCAAISDLLIASITNINLNTCNVTWKRQHNT